MKSRWLDRTLVTSPLHLTLCLTEKDFKRTLKQLNVDKRDHPEFLKNSEYAKVHWYESSNGHCAIVCMSPKGHAKIEIYALLVHESIHIWQWVKSIIGEKEPSDEFEAYSVQHISHTLFEEYKRQKG